ncbi:TonB family protein [Hymenobacter volaticus]|uniref:Energy transducer TonB n=1 Tax=Hymenobacter volaticus TaxID=2932254 RepID=A0ABY4G4J3_9BACT|nr:TonB family protein [Hymenobacter volaticus]UOQ65788.1 energy transducer TonB [Hymenobacter volaticus]
MNKHLLLISSAFLLLSRPISAQSLSPTSSDTVRVGGKIYTYVEQMPVFPGGQAALFQTIGQTIIYPTEALQQRLEGRVFVNFVVGSSGKVQDVKISKGAHPLLDNEAMRAVSALPSFTPGKQVGRPVPVAFTLPIVFKLPTNIEQILAERANPTPQSSIATSSDTEAKYPGGPEALLAYLATAPCPEAARAAQVQGRVFVKIKLDSDGRITEAKPLASPNATQLVNGKSRATTEALNKVLEQTAIQWVAAMPAWIPARKNGAAVASYSITLPVVFGPSLVATEKVYPYADQMPVFKNPVEAGGLQASIQRAATYPPQAMRNKVQGTVYVYFVVNEVGTLEQAQIISSPSSELDASVLAAIRSQSAAITPAQHQGKPVKVFYVMPFNFRMI